MIKLFVSVGLETGHCSLSFRLHSVFFVYNLAFWPLIKSPHTPHLRESGFEGLRLSTKPVFSQSQQ